jgi:DNA topoisomerase VI subunit A
MPATEKVKTAVATARPVVERLASDEDFQKHLKSAYESARHLYDELLASERAPRTIASRLTHDRALQEELRRAIEELREAARRAKGEKKAHKARNTLVLMGIVIGILYNPATGSQARRWLKEKAFGPEETFEYEP